MEKDSKKEIDELLGDITDFKPELEFGNEDMKIPDGKVVEKYFHIKLKSQFGTENSFSNIKIKISEFIDDLNVYMSSKVFKNDKLDKKVAKNILKLIKEYFKDENEIEIDSVYTFISGEKIKNFIDLINPYSYPYIEIEKIDPKAKYTVLVESTYCLKKNIIKKSEQEEEFFILFNNE